MFSTPTPRYNEDYFRLDGSKSSKSRQTDIDSFNHINNTSARLYLVSTRAGSLGVNLVAANRVVLMDVSFNPTYDLQAIFRTYRFCLRARPSPSSPSQ